MTTAFLGIRVDPAVADSRCDECGRAVRLILPAGVVVDADHVVLCREDAVLGILRATAPVFVSPEMFPVARGLRLWAEPSDGTVPAGFHVDRNPN